MRRQRHVFTAIAVPLALAAFTLPGMGVDTIYAQEKGTGAAPSKVEITIRDRVHGYETVGHTYPSQDTMIVVHNKDAVTRGLASMLFKEIRVSVENGTEIQGKYFKSFHVEPGKTMTLRFATAPSKFEPLLGPSGSLRYALWCDIHPEVKGEVYVIESRAELYSD
jgi:hypothetical protein